jgi:hypothetical protein
VKHRITRALAGIAVPTVLALACNAASAPDIAPAPEDASAFDDAEPDVGVDPELEPSDPDDDVPDGSADITDAKVVDARTDAKVDASSNVTVLWADAFDGAGKAWTREEKEPTANVVEVTQGTLHVHANESNQSRRAARWQAIATSFPDNSKFVLSFKFKIVSASVDYFDIAAFQVNNTNFLNTEYGLASYAATPSSFFDENAPPDEGPTHAFGGEIAYTPGVWYRAEITVARTGTTFAGTTKVGKDGQALVAVDTNGATYFGPTPPTKIDIGIGVFYTSTDTGEVDAVFDDVVVERR